MSMLRHFCAVLGLLGVLNGNASEGPYPEVFDEFITGWVDYDDGYYAAALRAFARAFALDPEFRPATEAMAASLGQMGMPEIGESILHDHWVSKGREYDYRPAIAFWGVFHSADIDGVSTAGLEQTITGALNNLVDLPVVLTAPSTKTWAERKSQTPCVYNLLIFLFREAGGEHAVARIHLIRNYNVESGKELDLTLSTIPSQIAHRKFEINLAPGDIAQLSENKALNEGLQELFDPNIEIEDPAYRIDAETAAPLDTVSRKSPWMYLSKASVSTKFALDQYQSIKSFYRRNYGNSATMAAVGLGFPEWLAHQLEVTHPMRPWLLADANHENRSSHRWDPKKARTLQEELSRDHPEHPALVAIQLSLETSNLHHLNYREKMPRILPHLEKLRQLPPDFFHNPRDLEYMERFEKTIRACLGQPVSGPFVPFIIGGAKQKMSRDGSFRLSFSGRTPSLLDYEVHTISNHSQFALEALIDRMSMITDAKMLFATYKEHVVKEDALGSFLKRSRNAMLWRIKCNDKETYKEACEWWIQVAVKLIEKNDSWGEIARVIPSHYLPYVDYNKPMVEAMNRRLEQRGLLQTDGNASLAFNCATTWQISFLDLSSKSQEAVIQYYRNRATHDLESYFRLLGWLNWSEAKQILRSEILRAREVYMDHLNSESNPRRRAKLAHKYGQLLVAADEPLAALEVCAHAFPDRPMIQEWFKGSKLDTFYALRTIQAKALAGAGRLNEADHEINQILEEIDGRFIQYSEFYIYGSVENSRHHSLSSTLLELKDKIRQKKPTD